MLPTSESRMGLGLVAFALCLGPAASAQAQSYTVSDIGTLGGDSVSFGRAINNSGQVVGSSQTNGAVTRGFLWDPSAGILDIGSLGGVFTTPIAVNDFAVVTGLSYVSDQPTNYHAFAWDANNGIEDLGSFGSGIYDTSQAAGINNLDMVVGTSRLESGFTTGFLWTPDAGIADLSDVLGFPVDGAAAINNSGQMVLISGGITYLCDNGTLISIGDNVTVNGINDAGQVVGSAAVAGTNLPFIWDANSGLQVIDLPAPYRFGQAFGVNNAGDVVGTMGYQNGETGMVRGFVWTGGTAFDLSGGGWTISAAYGINDNGQIAASGSRMSNTHALMLNPSN